MKKTYILVSLALISFASFTTKANINPVIESHVNNSISITVSVKSGTEVVKGALVKLVTDRMVIGAGTTDESGNTTINIQVYGGQPVTIEVFHSLYKSEKLKDLKLENGITYTVNLNSKTESVSTINSESEESVAKTTEEAEKAKLAAEEAKK